MAEFSLASIIPDPDTFRDTDGHVYEVRKSAMFGAIEYAKLDRIEKAIPEVLARLAAAEDKEAAAVEVEQQMNAFVALLMPEMPLERIQAIHFGEKQKFVTWWREQQERAPAGETKAGKPNNHQSRGRRLPASSTRTA